MIDLRRAFGFFMGTSAQKPKPAPCQENLSPQTSKVSDPLDFELFNNQCQKFFDSLDKSGIRYKCEDRAEEFFSPHTEMLVGYTKKRVIKFTPPLMSVPGEVEVVIIADGEIRASGPIYSNKALSERLDKARENLHQAQINHNLGIGKERTKEYGTYFYSEESAVEIALSELSNPTKAEWKPRGRMADVSTNLSTLLGMLKIKDVSANLGQEKSFTPQPPL